MAKEFSRMSFAAASRSLHITFVMSECSVRWLVLAFLVRVLVLVLSAFKLIVHSSGPLTVCCLSMSAVVQWL